MTNRCATAAIATAMLGLFCLAACQTTGPQASEGIRRFSGNKLKTAEYRHTPEYKFSESYEDGPLWVERFVNRVRSSSLNADNYCFVMYQFQGDELSQHSIARYHKSIASELIANAPAWDGSGVRVQRDSEVKVREVIYSSGKQIQTSAYFGAKGTMTTIRERESNTSSPIWGQFSFIGTVTETQSGQVAVHCIGASSEDALARDFLETVNGSFRIADG